VKYSIVKTGGKQYRAEVGTVIYAEKLEVEVGAIVELEVIMSVDNSVTKTGGKAKAKVIEHGKGEKLDIFKYKAKKNYRRRMGHRQPFTKLEVISI